MRMKKPAYSSGNYSEALNAGKAFDGLKSTRWASKYGDPQWIYVDLGSVRSIDRVRILWQKAYARKYKIQVSNDAANWTDVFAEENGDGGIDDIIFAPVAARYVRMYGIKGATQRGCSIKEFKVYREIY